MRAKCRVCGTPLDTSTAYKVVTYDANNKEKRAYFCDESHYMQYIEKIEKDDEKKKKAAQDRDKVYQLICEIFGVNEILNTALWREKVVWNKAFADDVIAQYLTENKQWLENTISNLDGGEYGKIRYLSTVLKNRLADFTPKTFKENKIIFNSKAEEHYETKYKKKTRVSLEDLEDDCDE